MELTELSKLVEEAFDLRFKFNMPPVTSGPPELIESLLEVRRRMDRVEEILANLTLLRGSTRQKLQTSKLELQHDWDMALVKSQQASKVEFEGAKERYAKANLNTFDATRNHQKKENAGSQVEDAWTVVNQIRWGLEGIRQDHLAMLRAFGFEMSLDR